MRLFFLCCFVACAVAAFTPVTSDPEVVVAVSARMAAFEGHAHPIEIAIETKQTNDSDRDGGHTASRTTEPAPEREPSVATAATAAPVATAAPAPTPKAEPTPTPKPTPKPTLKPAPTSTPGGPSYTRDEVKQGIRQAWGGNDEKAIAVADCESGLNPRASSPGGTNLGLWQFRIETWRTYGGSGDPRDASPAEQTRVAWQLFGARGWAPWGGCAS